MPGIQPEFLSDDKRSAQKYDKLVIALRHATQEFRNRAQGGIEEIDNILYRLMPHLIKAFEASDGMILTQTHLPNKEMSASFKVLFSTLSQNFDPIQSDFLQQLVKQNRVSIITNSGVTESSDQAIVELQALKIHNALFAPMRILNRIFVIGIYNKQNADRYPFLNADGSVLEFLLTFAASELRAQERLYREHEAIRKISGLVAMGALEELWCVIVQHATRLSNTKYAIIYSHEADQAQLIHRCGWDATKEAKIVRENPLSLNEPSLNAHVANSQHGEYLEKIAGAGIANAPIPFARDRFEKDVRSAYCVPLISQTRLVGTLYVASTLVDGIAIEDRQAIDRLASHAALALHNAQLFEQNQWALGRDEEIIKLQQAITNILQEQSQAQQIQGVFQPYFSPEQNFFIATWDEKREFIRPLIVYEHNSFVDIENHARYQPRQAQTQHGFIDYMLAHDLDVLDVSNFSTWADSAAIEAVFCEGVQYCFVLRLTFEKHIIGWLGVRGYARVELFDQRQRELLQRMAPHIAVVLYNSRQYEQKINERKVVSQFQTQISNLNENEAAEIEQISIEVNRALEALGLYTGDMYIALYDSSRQIIHTPVVYVERRPLVHEEREAHPRYRSRKIDERNGFMEWILTHDQPILAKTRLEIEERRRQGITHAPDLFQSWLGVPMKASGKTIGVMALRSLTQENLFAESHIELLQTIANQAAITIENARRYQEVQETSKYNEALHEASQAISKAGFTRNEVLKTIVAQAVQKTGCHMGVLYLKDRGMLKLVVPDSLELRGQLPLYIRPNDHTIVIRAMLHNDAQLIPDVTIDPDYVDVSDGKTKAQLAVLLFDGGHRQGEMIGVLSVEHTQRNGLNQRGRKFLISLSNLATIAIQNAEHAKELDRSKVVAVMGAWGADVMHDIDREVGRIREKLLGLSLQKELPATVKQALVLIDTIADEMRVPELPTNQSARTMFDAKAKPDLDLVLSNEVENFKTKKTRHRQFKIEFEAGCPAIRVRIHEGWLRRLLRHYLNNAERHLPATASATIRIRTEIADGVAKIFVEDNGTGVPITIQEQLFTIPIDHADGNLGRGLLLVRFICEALGGRAWLDWSEVGSGSCFAFSLPTLEGPTKIVK